MFLYKSYVSSGFCSSNYYKYGQVAAILSLLVSTSTLVLLLITVCDVGKGDQVQSTQTETQRMEENTLGAVKCISIFYISVQVLLLIVGLKSVICYESSSSFMLTVGVRERQSRRVTSYGATSETDCPVNTEDITVYYHRVKKHNCHPQLEPLTLPLTGWLLQGQILSFFLSLIIFFLLVGLTITDNFYAPITMVIFINLIQQIVQVILTWIHSTDVGFCCPGISVTRWFIHQDFYTEMIESLLLKKFKSSSGTGRAGEVRQLQSILEDVHATHYREVFPGQECLVSLFLTYQEILALSQYFSHLDQDQEDVLYTAESSSAVPRLTNTEEILH